MTENVTFRAEYAGYDSNGEKLAHMYKAYAEEGQPYVLIMATADGYISITQCPGVFLDEEVEQDPADDADRRNAIKWVETLSELIEKARAYDEMVGQTDEVEYDKPMTVKALDRTTINGIWEDSDGDHYKWDGIWYIDEAGNHNWRKVINDDYLTDYGPYTEVRS